MKTILSLLLFVTACAQCSGQASGRSLAEDAIADSVVTSAEVMPVDTIPAGAAILLKVYPRQVTGYADGRLLMADGTRIVYDDGRTKDFLTMLDESDPEDMFSTAYDRTSLVPSYLADAGRSRCEALFKSMYGHSAAEVQKHFTRVAWFGQQLSFTTVNGAADSLRAVAAELSRHPELKKYLTPASTFYWRTVRGAKRQSAHSYGMTIDVNTAYSDYWLWKNPKAGETDSLKYANRIPLELVEIFERHGFIWGGRWYHYDTMHFEYRPELLYERRQ